MINQFDFIQPHTIDDALNALAQSDNATLLAGGTNILVNMKRAPLDTERVIDISQLDSLKHISMDNGEIKIGAGVSVAQLLQWCPGGAVEGLFQPMCRAFAGPLIRNLATIGGNICDASAAADLSPVLLALDAYVHLERAGNRKRELSLADFFQGPRATARHHKELLREISFAKPDADEKWFYYKLGKRKADAISISSIAMRVKWQHGKIKAAFIALGAVAPVAMRAVEAEKILTGNELSDAVVAAAATMAAHAAQPIDDCRSTADYRRKMINVLVKKGLTAIKCA